MAGIKLPLNPWTFFSKVINFFAHGPGGNFPLALVARFAAH